MPSLCIGRQEPFATSNTPFWGFPIFWSQIKPPAFYSFPHNSLPSKRELLVHHHLFTFPRNFGFQKGKTMAVSFTRLSWCWWGGKEKEPANGSSLNSSLEWGFGGLGEPGTVQFTSVKGTKMASAPRKAKREWQSREDRRIDREYDVVLVPSDGGGYLSGSESDDSDWSIGWLEPHGPDFPCDDESDNSFAVLVPCYSPGCKEVLEGSNNELLSAIKNLPDEFSSDCKNYMEQWLSSLQNFDA